jgi:hypothetical protein
MVSSDYAVEENSIIVAMNSCRVIIEMLPFKDAQRDADQRPFGRGTK